MGHLKSLYKSLLILFFADLRLKKVLNLLEFLFEVLKGIIDVVQMKVSFSCCQILLHILEVILAGCLHLSCF